MDMVHSSNFVARQSACRGAKGRAYDQRIYWHVCIAAGVKNGGKACRHHHPVQHTRLPDRWQMRRRPTTCTWAEWARWLADRCDTIQSAVSTEQHVSVQLDSILGAGRPRRLRSGFTTALQSGQRV
jgi:hypothetical protein